jgi:hypothetical protein
MHTVIHDAIVLGILAAYLTAYMAVLCLIADHADPNKKADQ